MLSPFTNPASVHWLLSDTYTHVVCRELKRNPGKPIEFIYKTLKPNKIRPKTEASQTHTDTEFDKY